MQRKDKTECKSKTITFRVTEEDDKMFKQNAKVDQTSVGESIIRRVKSSCNVKPLTVAMIQDIINMAKDIALAHEPKRMEELKGKEDALWSMLN